nr:hypothetical protein [Tanacetum cinerariifolium]
MSSLFANTHNVVAILEKSDAVEGFEQIIDFLSGSYINYALTNQVGDLSTHATCFISSALTQKVFANMRRVRKVDATVAAAVEAHVAEDVSHDAIPSLPPHVIPS